jgi:uncharacterized membrane protein
MWLFRDSINELAVWLGVLVVLTVVAAYVIVKVRDRNKKEDLTGIELLTRFRDVHSQGGLSDAEFRTIKTRLADRLLDEVNDKEEKS